MHVDVLVERTQQLRETNQDLENKYARLKAAEQMLRSTQNELVQALVTWIVPITLTEQESQLLEVPAAEAALAKALKALSSYFPPLREGTRAESLMREHSRMAQRNLREAVQSQRLDQMPGVRLIRKRSDVGVR